MIRENGFYWVVYDEGPQVAAWSFDRWYIVGCEEGFKDSELEVISEEKIKKPCHTLI